MWERSNEYNCPVVATAHAKVLRARYSQVWADEGKAQLLGKLEFFEVNSRGDDGKSIAFIYIDSNGRFSVNQDLDLRWRFIEGHDGINGDCRYAVAQLIVEAVQKSLDVAQA
ncbi:hypothetical protein BGV48_00145 [Burkholderia ubonensis]|nr:hypothetical protein BGV48_00145 [Burkholderia ubonensis]